MDLVRLDSNYTFAVVDLIEGWESLLWNERFQELDDFKLVTAKISEHKSLLPIGAFVSLLDTRAVMRVDTHLIEKGEDGIPKLTISGTGLASTLQDHVAAIDVSNSFDDNVQQFEDTSAQVALELIQGAITFGNISAYDILHHVNPGVALLGSLDTKEFNVEPGELYQTVMDIIVPSNLGIRAYRAYQDGGDTDLDLFIYGGRDRTEGNSDGNAIVDFSYAAGDFENASYLWSLKAVKNTAYVYSPLGSQRVYARGVSGDPSGFARRIVFVNASDITEVKPGHTLSGLLNSRGRKELAKYSKSRKFTFDGQISENNRFKYKRDFFLGDLVTVQAGYSYKETMRVMEFIRNHDTSGESSYPTMVLDD